MFLLPILNIIKEKNILGLSGLDRYVWGVLAVVAVVSCFVSE